MLMICIKITKNSEHFTNFLLNKIKTKLHLLNKASFSNFNRCLDRILKVLLFQGFSKIKISLSLSKALIQMLSFKINLLLLIIKRLKSKWEIRTSLRQA